MNILLSFLQDAGNEPHAIPAYRFWSHYIKNGIEEAGMQWMEIPGLDWAAGLVPYENDPALNAWKAKTWEKTLAHIKANKQKIDVFLCYLYPKQIDVGAIKEIRKLGVPCVNFYCDHVREFIKIPDEFKVFDFMWIPEFEALPMYKSAGIDHIHLPMPVWIAPQYRAAPVRENNSISFIGSKDELRQKLLFEVISKGLPLEIRGSGWDEGANGKSAPTNLMHKINNQMGLIRKSGLKNFALYHLKKLEKRDSPIIPAGYIFDKPNFEDYVTISRESLITLGINRVASPKNSTQPLVYSRLRDLEAPMLGACYLTEYTEGLPVLYELGREIETYKNADELMYRCRELNNSASKRKELRLLGQKRALNSHAIPSSLQQLKIKLFH